MGMVRDSVRKMVGGEPLSSLLTVILGIIKGADPVVGLRFI